VANIRSARKRARQAEERRVHNRSQRTRMRTKIKTVVSALRAGDKARAEAAYKEAVPILDKMANKGIIHKNKAARHKARLNRRIRALG